MKANIFAKVEKNYKNNFDKLEDKCFHFVSRLFLWAEDEFSSRKLAELKVKYIGKNKNEYAERIKNILLENVKEQGFLFKQEREKYFAKYPLLKKYNKILFKNLFCENLYGVDLRGVIGEQIKKEQFLALRVELWKDRAAIAALATHAINYFYTLDYFLQEEKTFLDPSFFLAIVENENLYKGEDAASLQIYLLTHCIIGESAFYARPIKRQKKVYKQILLKAEQLVAENYEQLSLDSKVEFLVCAELCEQNSFLSEKILGELENSFDCENNYFIEKEKIKNKVTFRTSEHRNVLALMAFHFKKTKSEKKRLSKRIISHIFKYLTRILFLRV